MRLTCLRLLCLGLLSLQLIYPNDEAMAGSSGNADRVNRIIVKYKQAPDQKSQTNPQRASLRHAQGTLRHSKYKTGNNADIYYLEQPRSAAEARLIAQELMQDPAVEYAEPDYRRYPQQFPNDSQYALQWYLKGPANFENGGIKAEQAWDIERGSSNIVIAVIDTGILQHEDIARVLPGYDFISDIDTANDGGGRDPDPTDPGDAVTADECGQNDPENDEPSSWHGTLVTGLLIATTDNNRGIAGLDHRASVLPLRVLGKCGGDSSDIADAIRWAAGLPVAVPLTLNPTPADVINLSLGSQDPCTATEQSAIDAAVAAGVVVVAAAGNDGEVGQINSPANCDKVIAVAATTRQGAETCYTNVDSSVDLSAPGGNGSESGCDAPLGSGIHLAGNDGATTAGNNDYYQVSGTSFSTPMVAGTAALMKAVNNILTPDSIEMHLKNTARAFPDNTSDGFDDCTTSRCGTGILDVEGAVLAARDGVDSVPNPFSFTDQNNVDPNKVIISNSITVTGIDTPAAIRINGGKYSINGGSFTDAEGFINPDQKVRIRLKSSSASKTTVSARLAIGRVNDTFSVTTKGKSGGGGEAGWLLPLCFGPLGGALRRNRLKQKRPESL